MANTAVGLELFSGDLNKNIKNSRVLVVGAGGIGCELLKNLILTGFEDVEVVDLDTIDVSNLNRQFLFQKQHVGKSKAMVAKESAQKLNPNAKIIAHHKSIMSPEFDPDYFRGFSIVLNALDNAAARSHVNRMCLASDVPLLESGTAGYLGQVTFIKKGLTECYECLPRAPQKTYPGCTIRNTPSEPIHCIVWAKHLFNQLFGEADPDEDVSPDTEDPEAVGKAGEKALKSNNEISGNVERISTRSWAISCEYDSDKLFHKFFHDDIKYLLSMDKLWEKRRKPVPLDLTDLPDAVAGTSRSGSSDELEMRNQRIWSIKECLEALRNSVVILKSRLDEGDKKDEVAKFLIWDKDDDTCMDFVTSCANIRAHIFGISQKSRFDVKSMAGNIIPAIATTNAIIGAVIVMEAFKVLIGKFNECKTTYFKPQPNHRNMVLIRTEVSKPSPKCYVCAPKPEVAIKLNLETFTVGNFESKVLKSQLNMVAPDVSIDDGKGTIMISSEEGETGDNNDKFLSQFSIRNGTRLICDDFLQDYNLVVTLIQSTNLPEGQDFELIGDLDELKATASQAANGATEMDTSEAGPSSVQPDATLVEDDEELTIVPIEYEEPHIDITSKKRERTDEDMFASKKIRTE